MVPQAYKSKTQRKNFNESIYLFGRKLSCSNLWTKHWATIVYSLFCKVVYICYSFIPLHNALIYCVILSNLLFMKVKSNFVLKNTWVDNFMLRLLVGYNKKWHKEYLFMIVLVRNRDWSASRRWNYSMPPSHFM